MKLMKLMKFRIRMGEYFVSVIYSARGDNSAHNRASVACPASAIEATVACLGVIGWFCSVGLRLSTPPPFGSFQLWSQHFDASSTRFHT